MEFQKTSINLERGIKMIIKMKSFKNKDYNAVADYVDGKVNILAGSKISKCVSPLLAPKGTAIKLRNNSELVKDGVLVKDCLFNSLSTAAQFITGNITNGKTRWYLEDGRTMKKYLEENTIE